MSLIDRISQDLKAALKSGESLKVGALRFVVAQIHNQEIANRSRGASGELTDAEVEEVIKREVKKRKEAIELFRQNNRQDLLQKEEAELKVIGEYLPEMMDEGAIRKLVEEVIASGKSDFPSVMKEVMAKAKGRAPGSEVSRVVKEKLS